MNISVGYILQCEFLAGSSQITLLIEIALEISIDRAHHGEASDIELSVFIEKWLFDVLLDDIGSSAAVDVSVLDQTFDVVKVLAHLNAATPIGVLTRFHNP